MEKARCFFCNDELTELEIRLLDKTYLRVCLHCKNVLRFRALQDVRSKEGGEQKWGL